MEKDIILSICIPSYNRGRIALNLVKELNDIILQCDAKVEIVLSNNGSERFKKEYDVIESMSCERIQYHRFLSNQGFVRNFNQVIRLSRGKFCLLISDEDHVDARGLYYYIEYLKLNPSIGTIRCATTRMYSQQVEDCFYNAGMEAINGYFLQGNYLSGIIYNREILTNSLIDEYEKKYKNNEAYVAYPHMFVEAYLCTVADVFRCRIVLVNEGEDQKDQKKTADIGILPYATLEARVKQAEGYMEFIGAFDSSDGIKLKMISQVINKTFFLLSLVIRKYEINGYSIRNVFETLSNELKRIINNCNISVVKTTENILIEYIEIYKNTILADYEG